MKILSAFLTFMFCGIVNVWASQTTGINGLPSTLAVGDTVIVYASNGTMPYTWNSNNAGVVVVQLDSIQAKVIVLTAVPNVTISATDASSITGIQVISTYDFKTRIGNSTFIDGDTVEIPVFYSSHTALFDLLSADISLPYDTTVFKFIGFNKTGTLTNPMTVIFNQVYDTIKLGIAATFPAGPTSEQIFLKLRFVSKDSVITSTSRSLHFTRFHVNEQIEGAFVDGIVTVDPIPNYVPVFIISAPDTIINEGDLYTFTVLATDANNQTVHYFLTTNSAPVNEASIDSITGQFSFSPSYLSANVYAFVISADDGHGMTSINPFTITVNNVNLSPLITTGIPDTMYVAEGQNFFLDIDATDGDVEPLKYLIINPPIGMTIDSLTGIVNWNPNFTQSGVYNPTFKVKDSLEAFDSRYVVLIVLNVNRIPVFISILQDTIIAEDQLL